MALLHEVGFGRPYTHLDSLYGWIENTLKERTDPGAVLATLNGDQVYQAIAARQFRAPVPPWLSQPARRFEARLQRLQDLAQPMPDLAPFLNAASWFLHSHAEPWTDGDYFTVPVIVDESQGAMVYLRAIPRPPLSAPAQGLGVSDLTQDATLLSATKDYFENIAGVLMRTFYMLRRYPFDSREHLSGFTYRLFFGCQISEGESMGAAVLGTFAVAFLRQVLRGGCDAAIAPLRGTVITGRIEPDGRVAPVRDTAEKIATALEEFGSSIAVIVPEDSDLPRDLPIDQGRLTTVSRSDQLLATLLSLGDARRGLQEARRRVFSQLHDEHIRELSKHLEPGVEPEAYEQIAKGESPRFTPQSRDAGVYILARAWRNDVEVRLGLEPSAVRIDDSMSSSELLLVVFDGSGSMNGHWVVDPKTRISRIAEILFEIAGRIDPRRQQLIAGFLGYHEFYRIEAGELAEKIEDLLQRSRIDNKLVARGPYFTPVYKALLSQFADRQKKIYVISDHVPPDLRDDTALRVSELTPLRLSPDPDSNDDSDWIEQDRTPSLLNENLQLDFEAMRRYFSNERGTFASLRARFRQELPLEWEPTDGVLLEDEDGFELQWRFQDSPKARLRIRMAHQCPAALEYSGVLNRDGTLIGFRFYEPNRTAEVGTFSTALSGSLPEAEFEQWKTMCGAGEVHLKEDDPMSPRSRPVFRSLDALRQGWLCLRAGRSDWKFFRTGCQIGAVCFVLVNGVLRWSQARGHLAEPPREGDAYALSHAGDTYYLARL